MIEELTDTRVAPIELSNDEAHAWLSGWNAAREEALKEEQPTFRRMVRFQKGYNYLHETGPKRRGQHGMGIVFVLSGPVGAVHFRLSTFWTPLGQVDRGAAHREPCHIDRDGLRTSSVGGLGAYTYGMVNAPDGAQVGYHWLTPRFEDFQTPEPCPYLGGRDCYYDCSFLDSNEMVRILINKGEAAMWRALCQRYRDYMKEDA